jgi:hypothetical protein
MEGLALNEFCKFHRRISPKIDIFTELAKKYLRVINILVHARLEGEYK